MIKRFRLSFFHPLQCVSGTGVQAPFPVSSCPPLLPDLLFPLTSSWSPAPGWLALGSADHPILQQSLFSWQGLASSRPCPPLHCTATFVFWRIAAVAAAAASTEKAATASTTAPSSAAPADDCCFCCGWCSCCSCCFCWWSLLLLLLSTAAAPASAAAPVHSCYSFRQLLLLLRLLLLVS